MNYNVNIDRHEVQKFSDLAAKWWDPAGPCATLHALNPCRLSFIQQYSKLSGLRVLDIGCGAGILTESLAGQGAITTGIDVSEELIAAAKEHAAAQQLNVDYQVVSSEVFSQSNQLSFDVITCMELLEHVPDPSQLIRDCSVLLKPGGHLFLSTINRNPKAYALAIIGAEYLLNILPKRTHNYAKFIRPSEIADMCRAKNLQVCNISGMSYNPFTKSAELCHTVDVNYLLHAQKEI